MKRSQIDKWVVVFAMGLTLGLILLDETVVGLSLPTLQKALKLNEHYSHFIISAPLIALTCSVALFGRLSDFKGLQKGFFLGALLFSIGALIASSSDSLSLIVLGRILQGFGIAFLFPTSIAMVTLSFPENKKGLAIGVYGSIGTCFPPISALTAGAILERFNPSLIFLMPLPLLFLSTLLIALSYTPRSHLADPIKGHLFDFYLFLKPAFSASILVLFTAQFVKLSIVVFFAKALQNELLLTPYETSLALLPPLAIYPLITTLSGALTDRFGSRKLMMIALISTTSLFFFMSVTIYQKSYAYLLPPLILWAFATPFLFVSSMAEIMGSVSQDKKGEASGMGLTAQILGGVFAVSFLHHFQGLHGTLSPLFLATAFTTLFVTLITYALLNLTKSH